MGEQNSSKTLLQNVVLTFSGLLLSRSYGSCLCHGVASEVFMEVRICYCANYTQVTVNRGRSRFFPLEVNNNYHWGGGAGVGAFLWYVDPPLLSMAQFPEIPVTVISTF